MRRLILLLALLPALALAQLSGPPLNSPSTNASTATTATNLSGGTVAATTGTFSGLISSTVGNNQVFMSNLAATTGYSYINIINTGGNAYFGVNGSTGAAFTNGTAYGTFVQSGTTAPVEISVNGARVGSFATTGLGVTGTITVSTVASSTAAQTGYLCYNTTGGVITYDPSLTCLASREELKLKSGPITDGLKDVMALRPFWGRWRDDSPNTDKEQQPFLGARYTAKVDPRLATFDPAGEPLGVRYMNLTAVLVAAVQEQQRQINRLRHQLKKLRAAR